ncbi:MAG: hypothetical protein JW939_08950 [Candidatus Thermoplasmatota archaeon]|nr:hypothetical protein [Candidatus Thermoplasmatota archaeon]
MSAANAREMLLKAELALADGNFIRAGSMTKKASSLLDLTQSMHRQFMEKLKDLLKRAEDMEGRGYDISEARSLLENAKGKAMNSDYEKALGMISGVEPALDRATYLPFPLLNKTLEMISTIFYGDGRISYTVRIENPTSEPLGEIIIRPFLPEGDFEPVPERYFGVIGAREYKESTFLLVPKVKDWNLGVGREILMGEGVVLRTRLSSKGGTARYFITIENNSDQIIRDIHVSPMAPGGLGSEPASGTIDFVEPFAQKTLEFELFPLVLDRTETVEEKVVAVEEPSSSEAPFIEEEEAEDWLLDEEEDEELPEPGLDLKDMDEEEEIPEGPRDFTPVEEEFNLISMVPLKYPTRIESELWEGKKRGA